MPLFWLVTMYGSILIQCSELGLSQPVQAKQGVIAAGEEVERPARPVTVHSFGLHRSSASAQDLNFHISCSKGTYIRSLAHDLVICRLYWILFVPELT